MAQSQTQERQLQVQTRLDEIGADMTAISNTESITDEQSAQFEALEAEADVLTAELDTLRRQSEVEARRAKADAIREHAKASKRTTSPNVIGDGIGRVRPAIADDPKRGFRNFADFACRVYDAGNSPRADQMLMQVAAGTGMTSSVNTEGGVFVPPAFSKSIWDRVLTESNSMLSYCEVTTLDGGVESLTVPAVAESSRANGSRFGGLQGYWKSELTQLTSSRPSFREMKWTPNELYVFAYISDKLLRQAPGYASSVLEKGCAEEIAFKVGDAIIEGDGSGKPLGVVGHAATLDIAKETGQAAATINTANIRKMNARLNSKANAGAVWFVNQDVLPALETLQFEIGTGGVPVFLPPGGLSVTPYAMLYGKPVIPLEYCSTLGTTGDIILANMKWYGVVLRASMDAAYSMHLKFDFAQTAYRLIFEVDGHPFLNSAITPFKGTNTTAAALTLATRA